MMGTNTPPHDMRGREWEKLCAEVVARVRERFKKIDEHVIWLVASVCGSLPSDPPNNQPHYPLCRVSAAISANSLP